MPKTNYKYTWKDDPKIFATERRLKNAHPESCDPKKHDYKSTFVFGLYECRKCKVRREVK